MENGTEGMLKYLKGTPRIPGVTRMLNFDKSLKIFKSMKKLILALIKKRKYCFNKKYEDDKRYFFNSKKKTNKVCVSLNFFILQSKDLTPRKASLNSQQ